MSTTAGMPRRPGARGRRLQAFLTIAVLAGSVAGTALLVATPASSRPVSSTSAGPSALPTGTRVEVRGGEAFRAYELADRLEASGGRVVSVSPGRDGGSAGPATTVVYYDRRTMDVALRVRDMLGEGTLRRQQVFQPVVDVTIVLGKDLAQR